MDGRDEDPCAEGARSDLTFREYRAWDACDGPEWRSAEGHNHSAGVSLELRSQTIAAGVDRSNARPDGYGLAGNRIDNQYIVFGQAGCSDRSRKDPPGWSDEWTAFLDLAISWCFATQDELALRIASRNNCRASVGTVRAALNEPSAQDCHFQSSLLQTYWRPFWPRVAAPARPPEGSP